MTSLQNKNILITGASSGIGHACAHLLAAKGARLILGARRIDRLQSFKDAAHFIHFLDVREQDSVKAFFAAIPPEWQSIDVLINNAGLALSTDPIQSGNIDQWETMIDTNLKGLLYMTRQVLPGMIERNAGHIVNIGSVAGQFCYANGNVYSATKHAVRALSQSLRLDLGGTSIRVSEIAPAAVQTEFSVVRWNDQQKADAFYEDFEPLTAEDIADAIVYCLTRPAHVNISEMTLYPTAQSACSVIHRKKKNKGE